MENQIDQLNLMVKNLNELNTKLKQENDSLRSDSSQKNKSTD